MNPNPYILQKIKPQTKPIEYTPIFINPKHEIKISKTTNVHEAIEFILHLFTNKGFHTVKICGWSNMAIRKVVLITEIIKSKVTKWYQFNKIECIKGKFDHNNNRMDERWMIPRMEIMLTLNKPTPEQEKEIGYQTNYNYSRRRRMRGKHRKNLLIGSRRDQRVRRMICLE